MIADIALYYRCNEPSAKQLDAWFPFVSHISGHKATTDQIKNAIYLDCDNLPRNLPKAILAAYAKIPHEHARITYNRDSDTRFPVELLHQGLNLLLRTRDVVHFGNWADQVGMPKDDQDRVRHKANIMTERMRFDRQAFARNADAKHKAAAVAVSENARQYRLGRGPCFMNVSEAVRSVGNEPVWKSDKDLPPAAPVAMIEFGVGDHDQYALARRRNIERDRLDDLPMREPGEEG